MGASSRTEGVLVGFAALLPAALAATRVANVPDASRDAAVVRVLGMEPRVWREVDAAIGMLFQALPVGTRAARAGVGGALVAGVAGAVLYILTRALLEACAPTRRLGALVAGIAAVIPLAGLPWQTELTAIGGSATGALLVFLPLWLIGVRGAPEGATEPTPPTRHAVRCTAFALALALGSEPAAGVCAAIAVAAYVGAHPPARRELVASARDAPVLGLAFAAGLAPWALGFARARAAGLPLGRTLAAGWAFEGSAGDAHRPLVLLASELGAAIIVFALGGAALALVAPRARPLCLALAAVAISGLAWGRVLACGPSSFAAPILASLAAACVLAGAGMQALVRLVASARVPMARASAAMVFLLELVLPVDVADEALARRPPTGVSSAWDDVAWGELPPEAVVLVSDEGVWQRAAAARARGSVRGDVTLIALDTATSGPSTRRALASDPSLLPLWRDLEIAGAPSEASLGAVAAVRPLFMAYQPRWGRVLAAHLVPDALFDRFELEPRGASDRRVALALFAPTRARLARLVTADGELARESAHLLGARALLFATLDSRDEDAVGAAIADVRAFAPDDPLAAKVTARLASKGPQRFDDLRP